MCASTSRPPLPRCRKLCKRADQPGLRRRRRPGFRKRDCRRLRLVTIVVLWQPECAKKGAQQEFWHWAKAGGCSSALRRRHGYGTTHTHGLRTMCTHSMLARQSVVNSQVMGHLWSRCTGYTRARARQAREGGLAHASRKKCAEQRRGAGQSEGIGRARGWRAQDERDGAVAASRQ